MNKQYSGTSQLALTVEVLDNRPDRPVVTILVDGEKPFAGVASTWQGFDPDDLLGAQQPLVPREPAGRRVAVHRCSCGEPGCGVIAPVIVGSPDGRLVSWVDFSDYVGVFCGPTYDGVVPYDGRPWPLPDLHFDRGQYEAEVARATADRSWETPRRKTARLIRERLDLLQLSPDLTLRWVAPGWTDDGIVLAFDGDRLLKLTSRHQDPDEAAGELLAELLSTPVGEWVRAFGWRPSRLRKRSAP
ncbi:hypothetical protein [Kribbella sp. NPDC051718]|uniref:hypothetical protein n=1 Tax=Kribbella sp. NPDC051718 TaxID=3155168 RepID=UPI0034212492